jgi:hypothetical protein
MIIRTIHDDPSGWKLNRVLWVADAGFDSLANRGYLQRAGGHCVLAEKLRSRSAAVQSVLARAGRYATVADNLSVKEVRLGEGARAERFVLCHNPEAAERDRQVRRPVFLAGSDPRGDGVLDRHTRYAREVREPAVRLFFGHERERESQWR